MTVANRLMILGALLAFGASAANAGPCNTASRDAGSGNVPGYTGQTVGSTATDQQHPPTSAMNKAAENTATSSEDRGARRRASLPLPSNQGRPRPHPLGSHRK